MLASTHRSWRRLPCWGFAVATVMVVAMGCAGQETELSLEQRAQEIDKSLMCPVCPSETVDQSQVELAKQMRALIREKLAAGESRQEILDFFVSRYGEDVLAEPPKSGFNLLVWTLPVVALVGGGVALVVVLRVLRGGRGLAETPFVESPPHEELAPYMSRVEEEMQQVLEGGRLPKSPSPPAEQS